MSYSKSDQRMVSLAQQEINEGYIKILTVLIKNDLVANKFISTQVKKTTVSSFDYLWKTGEFHFSWHDFLMDLSDRVNFLIKENGLKEMPRQKIYESISFEKNPNLN